jgi:hypothetical protein
MAQTQHQDQPPMPDGLEEGNDRDLEWKGFPVLRMQD